MKWLLTIKISENEKFKEEPELQPGKFLTYVDCLESRSENSWWSPWSQRCDSVVGNVQFRVFFVRSCLLVSMVKMSVPNIFYPGLFCFNKTT